MAKVFNQQNNHTYWPFLVKDHGIPDRHLIVIFSLSLERGFFILSEFTFPSTEMVLEKCKEDSTRSPNSFIIFRSFFCNFVSNIPPHQVSEISNIAKAVWSTATKKMKNAFKLLENNVGNYLRIVRVPSFIMHHDDNPRGRPQRRISNISNSTFSDSSAYEVNGPVDDIQFCPPLNIEVITAKTFNESEPLAHSSFAASTYRSELTNYEFIESKGSYPVEMLLQDFGINNSLFMGSTSTWNPPGPGYLDLDMMFEVDSPTIPAIMGSETSLISTTPNYLSLFPGPEIDRKDDLVEAKEINPQPTIILCDDTAEYEEFCSQLHYEDLAFLHFDN